MKEKALAFRVIAARVIYSFEAEIFGTRSALHVVYDCPCLLVLDTGYKYLAY